MKVNKHLHMNMRPSVEWFSPLREEILRVWSRKNLEGQCLAWTGFTSGIIFICLSTSEDGIWGFLHAGEYATWTAELDGMWRSMLWER